MKNRSEAREGLMDCSEFSVKTWKIGDVWYAQATHPSGEIIGSSMGLSSDNIQSLKDALDGVTRSVCSWATSHASVSSVSESTEQTKGLIE